MTLQYEYEGRRRSSGAVISLILAVLLGAAALATFLRNAEGGLAGRLAALISGRSQSFVAAPDVVERIERLNRLETVVYSLDTVVEGKDSSAIFPDVLAGDRLLMIVHGQTIAGVDFSQLKPADVQVGVANGVRTIRLRLPPSQIFFTTIDNGKTRVYTRSTGLFVAADPNLETATRQKAQAELQSAALADGILKTANDNAQGTVRALLQGLGFAKIVLLSATIVEQQTSQNGAKV